MADRQKPPILLDLLGADFAAGRGELPRRFREGVQHALAEQRAAGHTIYFCGTGDESGKLFMHTPDDHRFQYRVCPDGRREIGREVT